MSLGHQDKPEECDSCGFETDELTETSAYARTHGAGPETPDDQHAWAWLCEVCRSTQAGVAYLYPRLHRDDLDALQTIAWGINTILAAVKQR